MNRHLAALGISLLIFIPVTTPAVPIDINPEFGLVSLDLLRGRVVRDQPLARPALTVSHQNLTVSAVGYWELDADGADRDDRLDIRVTYRIPYRFITLAVGGATYEYGNSLDDRNQDTYEIFASASLNVPLRPTATLTIDTGDIKGAYLTAGAGHSLQLRGGPTTIHFRLALDAADAHYNAKVFDVDDIAFVNATASLGVAIKVGPALTITPGLRYMTQLDRDIKASSTQGDERFEAAELSLAAAFGF